MYLFFVRTLGAFLDKDSKCYTLEVSFFQQKDPYTREVHPYTIDKCELKREEEEFGKGSYVVHYLKSHHKDLNADMELGRNIVLTFLDYYF